MHQHQHGKQRLKKHKNVLPLCLCHFKGLPAFYILSKALMGRAEQAGHALLTAPSREPGLLDLASLSTSHVCLETTDHNCIKLAGSATLTHHQPCQPLMMSTDPMLVITVALVVMTMAIAIISIGPYQTESWCKVTRQWLFYVLRAGLSNGVFLCWHGRGFPAARSQPQCFLNISSWSEQPCLALPTLQAL